MKGLLVLALVTAAVVATAPPPPPPFDCSLCVPVPALNYSACFLHRNGTQHSVPFGVCPGGGSTVPTTWRCWAVRNETLLAPGPCGCPEDCSRHGLCQQAGDGTARCLCDSGFSGASCSQFTGSCPPGTSMRDCSGRIVRASPPPGVAFPKWNKYGWEHPLFNRSTITQAYVTVAERDLLMLLDPTNEQSHAFANCTIRIVNENLDVTLAGSQIRLQGGFSRTFFHKSWKIKFGDTKYQSKGITFKAGEMEPTLLRELASADTFAVLGAPVYRASYYQVFFNGQSFGAHLGLEAIDKKFVESRFDKSGGGDLFKCVTTFMYLGPLNASTAPTYNKLYNHESGTNEKSALLQLVALVELIESAGVDDIPKLEAVMDLDMVLRTYAAEVLTGNWDGTWNGNNYYLYLGEGKGSKWIYFRHDLDMSFGALEPLKVDFSVANIWNWTASGPTLPQLGKPSPLIALLMQSAKYRELFAGYLLSGLPYISSIPFEAMQSFAAPLAENDIWRVLDFVWRPSDFLSNIDQDVVKGQGAAIWMAIRSYLTNRVASIKAQIGL